MGRRRKPSMIMSVLREEFITFFHQADEDKDGYLTLEELTNSLRSHGYRGSDDQIIQNYFKLADVSGNNKISMSEYMMSMDQADIVIHSTAAMRRVFNTFDKDGSGAIDKCELKTVFANLGRVFTDDEIQKMMKVADTDNSGLLEYEEFIEVMFGSIKC